MHLLLRVQVLAMALLNSGLIALVLHEMHAGCIFTFSYSVLCAMAMLHNSKRAEAGTMGTFCFL